MTIGSDSEQLLARLADGEVLSDADLRDAGVTCEGLQHPAARVLNAFNRLNMAAAEALVPPERVGPYRLVRVLGVGGMGEVWLGERADGLVERRVAIKRVRRDVPFVDARLRQERQLLVRLSHPNIAAFIDAGIDDHGTPWLAMEYVDGMPLHEWCDREQASLTVRLRILHKLSVAVAHAHQQLIVHRDIKPSNVLVDARGEPKLLDFGIAKWLDESPSDATLHMMTPAYAAPEQLRGEPVSTATDLYALGLLMFRVLAGALPETRRSQSAASIALQLDLEEQQRPSVVAVARSETLPYRPQVLKGDLDAIVGKAIRQDAAARYVSAWDLAEDLERYLNQEPVRARGRQWRYQLGRLAARHKLASILALSTLLSLLGGSFLFWQQSRRAEHEAIAAREQALQSEQLAGFLTSMFSEQDPVMRAGDRAKSPSAMLSEGVRRVQRELQGSPVVQARLLSVLADGQYHLGETGQAEQTMQAALAIAGDRPEYAATLAHLYALQGTLAVDRFDLEASHVAFEQAAQHARTVDHGDGLETARVNTRRIRALLTETKLPEAERLARRTHQRLLALRGPGHQETLEVLQLLCSVLEQQREDAEALVAIEQLIGLIEQHRGPDDVRLVRALLMRASIAKRAAHSDQAERDARRAVAIGRAQIGDRHTLLARAHILLATIQVEREQTAAAVAELDQALAASPDADLVTRAQIFMSRGEARIETDPARAETDLREALRLRQQFGGSNPALAWFTQAVLGTAVGRQRRFAEAEALQREAFEQLRANLGADAYQNALILQQQAFVSAFKLDWATSAAQIRSAIAIVAKKYPEQHPISFHYRQALLDRLLHLPNAQDEALALANQLLTHWQDRPEVTGAMAELSSQAARAHAAVGDHVRAKEIAAMAIAHTDWPRSEAVRQNLQGFLDGG